MNKCSCYSMSMSSLRLLILLSLLYCFAITLTDAGGGHWTLLQASTGISAMHMQLLHNDRIIIFDRTDFGRSNLSLPNGNCRRDPDERVLKTDCTAHSIEYDVATNTFRPLTVQTDTWCSSGSVDPAGILVQTGGFNDGDHAVRMFRPCDDGRCDWAEIKQGLAQRRWYATNQILPDGRAIIVGGRRQFNYEFYPKSELVNSGPNDLPLLRQTLDPEENNLYPFVHLNVDGNIFIFSNNRAILLDYKKNVVVRVYPMMPGGDPRNYPSSGSSVLLPLPASGSEAEVLVCGGAPKDSYNTAQKFKKYVQALNTCGRIKITDESPSWQMETMPMARVMGDMVVLPTAQVLLINGAGAGTAGWENAESPVLTPVTYTYNAPSGYRFGVQPPTKTPRLYHSTAVLLRDGRILVGGSNPHVGYDFSAKYPTDLSLEALSPDYLNRRYDNFRPRVHNLPTATALELKYGMQFELKFTVGVLSKRDVYVTMVAPPFATHSFSMNQRLLMLDCSEVSTVGSPEVYYIGVVTVPASEFMAPAGYYMVFVVNGGIPSEGIWAHIQ